MKYLPTCLALAVLLAAPAHPRGDDKPASGSGAGIAQDAGAPAVPDDPRFRQFAELLSNVKLVGRFTILGKEDGPLSREEYAIIKVDKLPEGDKWMFHCRIQYGGRDLTLPLPLDVKWADDTPIITLTNLAIPPLGTFSSRVVLYDNKYAGTWRHDNVSGHLFGTIEKIDDQAAAPDAPVGKQ